MQSSVFLITEIYYLISLLFSEALGSPLRLRQGEGSIPATRASPAQPFVAPVLHRALQLGQSQAPGEGAVCSHTCTHHGSLQSAGKMKAGAKQSAGGEWRNILTTG